MLSHAAAGLKARDDRPWVSPHGELLRGDAFTPYAAETIADDALAAGRGAFLDIALPADTTDAEVEDVRARFAWLHGVVVHVARDDGTQRTVAA